MKHHKEKKLEKKDCSELSKIKIKINRLISLNQKAQEHNNKQIQISNEKMKAQVKEYEPT